MKKSTKKSGKKSVKQLKKKSRPAIPPKLQKLVSESASRYLKVLGYGNYEVKIYWQKHDAPKGVEQRTEGGAAATMTVDQRYLRGMLKVYPYLVNAWINKNLNDQGVEEIIAHEISHIATNHLFTIAVATYKEEGETHDAWEMLTTIVGRLVHEVDMRRRGFKKNI